MNVPTTEARPRTVPLDVDGEQLLPASPGYPDAIARAYAERRRPRCLCRSEGIEMYIASFADGYIVKRMPGTGDRHAPDCPSFEPTAELIGLQPLLGTAIREDPETGLTQLRLGFSLSKHPERQAPTRALPSAVRTPHRVARLSLRALLHYLWDQAELTRWHPGFEARRSWGVVRRQLLRAAAQMLACGEVLESRLYIPEIFSLEQQDAITERRHARWSEAAGPGGRQRMILLIAEVKELATARYGHKAVIKHVPDIAFALDAPLYAQLEKRFERELALWSASSSIHMIIGALMNISPGGLPHLAELSLMTVTEHWLPVEGMAEAQLVGKLVRNRRAFSKLLRYDLRPDVRTPSLALTDCGDPVRMVFAGEIGEVS